MFARKDSLGNGSRSIVYYENQLILMTAIESSAKNSDKIPLLERFSASLQSKESIVVSDKGYGYIFLGSPETQLSSILIGQFISNSGNSLIFKESRSDTVFYYRNGAIEPAYVLAMGRYSIPAEMFGSITELEQWRKYGSIEQIYDGDRYVVVEAGALGALNYLVFDKCNLSEGSMEIEADGALKPFIGGIKFTPQYIRDNRLVGYIQAFDIVNNAETITNIDLKALAATLQEDSNPVIVVATLKK
jgi:hypothetical protein